MPRGLHTYLKHLVSPFRVFYTPSLCSRAPWALRAAAALVEAAMAESMLAELAMLQSQMEREQASLKRIVFGAISADEPPVPDQPSSSQIIRSGSQWTGTLGCSPYHLVFCWRDDSWLEAVGIYPGIGASRIEGDISFSPVRAVPATTAWLVL